jgi:hypothetical protein
VAYFLIPQASQLARAVGPTWGWLPLISHLLNAREVRSPWLASGLPKSFPDVPPMAVYLLVPFLSQVFHEVKLASWCALGAETRGELEGPKNQPPSGSEPSSVSAYLGYLRYPSTRAVAAVLNCAPSTVTEVSKKFQADKIEHLQLEPGLVKSRR